MTIDIDTKTLARLRDYLLTTGERRSVFATGAQAHERSDQHPLEGDDEARGYFDAVAETMFLMCAADGVVHPAERDVLRGALRELTDNQMRSAAIDKLVTSFEASLSAEGQAARLGAVAAALKGNREASEAAFVLSAAVAFADDDIADAENDVLNDLAERLGIDPERAETLLDEIGPRAEGSEGA